MTEVSRRWDEVFHQEVRRKVRAHAENGLAGLGYVAPWRERLKEVVIKVRGRVRGDSEYGLGAIGCIAPGPERLKEVVINLRDGNAAEYRELMTDPSFLEDIAIMIDYGGIDFDIVDLSLGYQIAYRWSLWKPTVVALRNEYPKTPDRYINFERLAKRIAINNPQSVSLDEDGEVRWEGFRD